MYYHLLLLLILYITTLYTTIATTTIKHLSHNQHNNKQHYTDYGEIKYTLIRPEGERYYYVYIPRSYTSEQSVSIHISFHGLGGDSQSFAASTGFNELAEIYNFIHVYPHATDGFLGPGWNAGTCCIGDDGVDDIGFTHDVINDVIKHYNIDTNHIYAAGFSNGAFMCETLACTSADIFHGIASVAGDTVIAGGFKQCDKMFNDKNTSLSILHIHGDSDEVVPYTGSDILGFPDIQQDVQQWVTRNQCSKTSKQNLNVDTISSQLWETNCYDNQKIELVVNKDGGHIWPITQHFNTSHYIVDFFNSLKPRYMYDKNYHNDITAIK